MKINESRIRQIIREEAHRVLREGTHAGVDESPRQKLIDYLEKNGGEDLVSAVLDQIDRALDRSSDRDEAPTSEDVTFNLSNEIINMIPEDDEEDWHEMLDAVLKDEFEPDDGEYESTRETERELGHWSNFIPPRGSNR